MLDRREFVLAAPSLAAVARQAAGQTGPRIRQIDVIQHAHLDVGYTDSPSVALDRETRYMECAIDLCRADKTFRWTVESLVMLENWWKTASAARRNEFLGLIAAGQMDVMAMPFNQTPFLNATQWRQMMSWIPAELWRAVHPRAAMQNDVNGFPRAGAMGLLDHGVQRLLMGINPDNGGPPFRRPSAFWWKMPDGRRLFVWLGEQYGAAGRYLGGGFGPGGSTLATNEQSVRTVHANCLQRIQAIESAGYNYERLILTSGSDNRAPSPQLAVLVAAWNRLGLQPAVRLTTATETVLQMEKEIGGSLRELEGEFTDWWANGDASAPREVAASRYAKRYVAAALSPAWGPMPASAAPALEGILKDLCLFDEHTWGADASISAPYDLQTLGQWVEKSELAYRPMGMAQWLLARRSRTKLDPLPEGVYVVNTAPAEISGWATLGGGGGRGGAMGSLVDAATGARIELRQEAEIAAAVGVRIPARFWVGKLAANSIRAYRRDNSAVTDASTGARPAVDLGPAGWPVNAAWPGMRKPLFAGSPGEFLCVGTIPPADRVTITALHANPDPEKRDAIRKQSIRQTAATYGETQRFENPHTLTYTQEMRHARIEHGRRTLELWKEEPRARVAVKFDRLSSVDPELFYLAFALPEGSPLPGFSCGGVPFTPYRDQLPGACRDYFAVDGWAHYATPEGHWLWVTRDAPLAVVGGPHALELHQEEPPDRNRILAMVFDNCWRTNFVADSHGPMEFQFDLVWNEKMDKPAEMAEALMADPVVVLNPAVHQSPALMKGLYRP
ncbi:MAG: hypothetical protein ABSC23_20025 [Bryobacteraceae bacterium]